MLGCLQTNNIRLNGSDTEAKRAEILEYFYKTYEIYEKLFEILADDSVYYEQPEPLRHPLIFYFGHTAVFYINKLLLAKKLNRIDPRLESIFAVGVDEMSWDDLNSSNYKWPSVAQTREYRAKVKEAVANLIKTEPLSLPITWNDTFWTIMMGIEHERIHLETSSVLIRQLDVSKVHEHELFRICDKSGSSPRNELIKIAATTIRLGRSEDGVYYGWDNEYGTDEVELQDFQASKYLVSNEEFAQFARDGGYQNDEYWESEGLSWRNYTGAKHPVFWVEDGEGYRYRTMTRIIDMPWNWPVDVNFHEAKAFCNYKSAQLGRKIRLPSEAEWHAIAAASGCDEKTRANINLEHYASACPVDMFAHGYFYDVVGNVWQWCETPIYPFNGFRVHPYYDDFSLPTFDDRHNIINGGSFISTGNELLPHSRYAFRRHFFQHAGFRYVDAQGEAQSPNSVYESDLAVSEYIEFHYGDEYFDVPNFAKKMAEIAISFSAGTAQSRALDIGCSVGRSSFELAHVFDDVTGLDFSARFIKNGVALKVRGALNYKIKLEGEIFDSKSVSADELGLDDESRRRVQFWQADACNLKPNFTGYDLVLAANLIDRLYAPTKFLMDIHERLNDGGVLVLASPYSWSESFTDKSEWLGGRDGKTTYEAIKELLEPYFISLSDPFGVEFVIRESERKFQHTISEVSVWRKR